MSTLDQTFAAITAPNNRGRVLLFGVMMASVVGAFAYTGGWLSKGKLTPARMIDAFEQVNGPHPGFRRNHAKGMGVSGYFEASGQGARFSRAAVFKQGARATVVGRFALAGGMPYAADTEQNVRSLALSLITPDGAEWRTGMNNIPVFVVNTPEDFYALTLAGAPDPKTGKPNPENAKAFVASHPNTARALKLLKAQPPASGFDNSTYNSLNAFQLLDSAGHATPVRWAMVPETPFAPGAAPASAEHDFLFSALIRRLSQGPVRFRLILTIGQASDSTSDATIPWPADREKVDAGTLLLEHAEPEATSSARTINFDPLILPDGIVGSDDPLLSARSAAYSQSFTRRVGEPVSPSAVTGAAQ